MGWWTKKRYRLIERKGDYDFYEVVVPEKGLLTTKRIIKIGKRYYLFGPSSQAEKHIIAKNIRQALKKLLKNR